MVDVNNQLKRLDPKKATPLESIPGKILKENSDIFLSCLTDTLNLCLSENYFPNKLKDRDVSSLFKKDDTFCKKNYRPITVLPVTSKIFERLLYDQIMPFAGNFLLYLLCGFRKGYNTQHALLRCLETCKMTLDKGGIAGALLMDLSKAFDCIDHELLIAKLHAYGFGRGALLMIHSYLSQRRQRVKINGSFSTWKVVQKGVPQGSVLGPLLFNVYINDLFLLMNRAEICNYADDTTLYICDSEINNVIDGLEQDATHLSTWYPENYMKLNADKCHFMIFGEKKDKMKLHVGKAVIEESDEETLLGVILDTKLNFKTHLQTLCKKASQKLHALSRISIFMEPKKLKLMMNTFIMSQFSYCPLIWMFHDKNINNKINRIQERALRIAYKDNNSPYEKLLENDNSVSIHQKNLQLLMVEIYKTRNHLNPSFMMDIFEEKSMPYQLRSSSNLNLPKVRTTCYGTDAVRFMGQRVWAKLPVEVKTSDSLTIFKKHLKTTKCKHCNCRICKPFIYGLGYL